MDMLDLKSNWKKGSIEKKVYWTLMRDHFTNVIPQMQKILSDNKDCESITITGTNAILQKRNGTKLLFDFSQTICRAEADLIMGEDPEKADMDYVIQYLQNHSCKNVLDIGANVGIFSLELYYSNSNLTYHVFEPLPGTYEKLKESAELNQADPERYKTYNLGMSDVAGEFDFYLPAASEAASLRPINDDFYLRDSNDMGIYTGRERMEKVSCKVETVDEFVQSHSISEIGFIKIDVEGNEMFVLKGAKETLKEQQPLVYCELLRKHAKRFGYHPNDVIQYMKELNYRCFTMRGGDLAGVSEINEDTEETNFFFCQSSEEKR